MGGLRRIPVFHFLQYHRGEGGLAISSRLASRLWFVASIARLVPQKPIVVFLIDGFCGSLAPLVLPCEVAARGKNPPSDMFLTKNERLYGRLFGFITV